MVTSVQIGVVPPAGYEGASVDPTDARNDILGCFGRIDRRAQRTGLGPALSPCESLAETDWVINGSGMP
jgi:hypothetical protein